MRSRLLTVTKIKLIAMIGVLTAIVPATGPTIAKAATTTARHVSVLLYNYNFKGTGRIVNNSAPAGPKASLTLHGTWQRVPEGVRFSGNTDGAESVAYGRPASGYTLNQPSSNAVGIGTRIVYYTRPGASASPIRRILRRSAGIPNALNPRKPRYSCPVVPPAGPGC